MLTCSGTFLCMGTVCMFLKEWVGQTSEEAVTGFGWRGEIYFPHPLTFHCLNSHSVGLLALPCFILISFFFLFLLCSWLFHKVRPTTNQPEPITINNQRPPTATTTNLLCPFASWHLYSLRKVPRIPNITLSAAGKIPSLLEHDRSHTELLWMS